MSLGRLGSLGRGFGWGRGGGSSLIVPGRITAGAGSYTWSGDLMTPLVDHSLAAGGSSYTYSGQDVSFLRSRLLAATGGSYTYTGQDATLTKAGGAAAWAPNATAVINDEAFGSTTSTFNLTLTSAATDTVVIMISVNLRAISGVTIGGNAMTSAVLTTGTSGAVGIYSIVGAYTNPTVVVTSAASAFQFVGCSYGKWTGASAVPSGTTASLNWAFRDTPAILGSLTVPSGGVLLAVVGSAEGAGLSWNNITEDADTASGTSWEHSSAHHSTAGAIAASQNGTAFTGNALAAITIGP